MDSNLILLITNIAIGFWFIRLIQKQDYYSEISIKKLALVTFAGGAIASGISIGISFLLDSFDLSQGTSVASFFLLTGPIEEISKLIGFFIFIKMFQLDFEEPIDAVVCMSCVALGFSLIENLGYALGTPYLLGVRSITSTPMHIIFSATMALVFATNTRKDRFFLSLAKAIIMASFFHGLFDAMVYLEIMRINMLFTFMIVAIVWAQKAFGYAQLNSPNRKYFLEKALANGKPGMSKLCMGCNKESPHQIYKFGDVAVGECQSCKNIILPEKKAQAFLKFFLPHFNSFLRKRGDLKTKLDSFYKPFTDNKYDAQRKININEARSSIEELAEAFREIFEKSYTFSFIFGVRPLFSTSDGIINEQFKKTLHSDALKITFILFAVLIGTVGVVFGLMTLLR